MKNIKNPKISLREFKILEEGPNCIYPYSTPHGFREEISEMRKIEYFELIKKYTQEEIEEARKYYSNIFRKIGIGIHDIFLNFKNR